jgi:hypothetical protein
MLCTYADCLINANNRWMFSYELLNDFVTALSTAKIGLSKASVHLLTLHYTCLHYTCLHLHYTFTFTCGMHGTHTLSDFHDYLRNTLRGYVWAMGPRTEDTQLKEEIEALLVKLERRTGSKRFYKAVTLHTMSVIVCFIAMFLLQY